MFSKSTYWLRAECLLDIQRLSRQLGPALLTVSTQNIGAGPDVTARIEVLNTSLADMRNACRRIVDGHVMLQTVNTPDNYTGHRNPNLV